MGHVERSCNLTSVLVVNQSSQMHPDIGEGFGEKIDDQSFRQRDKLSQLGVWRHLEFCESWVGG